MKHNDIEMDVLARYLSGECSEAERDRVEQWIEYQPENRQKFEEYKHIWRMSGHAGAFETHRLNINADWKALNRKIDEPKTESTVQKDNRFLNYSASKKTGRSIFLRAAAIFLVAALIGTFAYQNWAPVGNDGKKSALRQITTDMGQRVNLTLSDGTHVLLNADSEMKLPEVFDSAKREVFLEGQAFFNVSSNPEKPFVIHSGGAKTRVLGTAFSVRAYPDDGQITVAVKKGRVSFEAANQSGERETILNSRELARYNTRTHQVQKNKIDDMELYLGWVDGYLKFREAPMTEVATELERRYGVSVSFDDETIKQKLLTAQLKSRSIRNVLDVISMSLNIGYKIDGDQVVFFKS